MIFPLQQWNPHYSLQLYTSAVMDRWKHFDYQYTCLGHWLKHWSVDPVSKEHMTHMVFEGQNLFEPALIIIKDVYGDQNTYLPQQKRQREWSVKYFLFHLSTSVGCTPRTPNCGSVATSKVGGKMPTKL